MKNTWSKFKLLVKVRKANKFRFNKIQNRVFYSLLLNKMRICKARNELIIKNVKVNLFIK